MEKGIIFLVVIIILIVGAASLFYAYPQYWQKTANYLNGSLDLQYDYLGIEKDDEYPDASDDIDEVTNQIISSSQVEDVLLNDAGAENEINDSIQAINEIGESYNENEF